MQMEQLEQLKKRELDSKRRELIARKATILASIAALEKAHMEGLAEREPNERKLKELRHDLASLSDEVGPIDRLLEAIDEELARRAARTGAAEARVAELGARATALRAKVQACLDRVDAVISEVDASIKDAAEPYLELRPIRREISALCDEYGIEGDCSPPVDPCPEARNPSTCALESRATRLRAAAVKAADLRELR